MSDWIWWCFVHESIAWDGFGGTHEAECVIVKLIPRAKYACDIAKASRPQRIDPPQ